MELSNGLYLKILIGGCLGKNGEIGTLYDSYEDYITENDPHDTMRFVYVIVDADGLTPDEFADGYNTLEEALIDFREKVLNAA